MNTIIFSKDRPAQLDALLTSIRKYSAWMWPAKVLYAYSSDEMRRGYEILATEHGITPIWQLPLKEVLLREIDQNAPVTSMLVDDSIFFRPTVEISYLTPGSTFAFRLGVNCTHCYPMNRQQSEGELDFLYSLTIDGHVYNTGEILDRIKAVEFSTPNQLEDRISRGQQLEILYDKHSSIVSIPHNRVAEYANRNEGGSAASLNERYLAGERIDIEAMDFSNVVGAHQAIPYKWRQK